MNIRVQSTFNIFDPGTLFGIPSIPATTEQNLFHSKPLIFHCSLKDLTFSWVTQMITPSLNDFKLKALF